MANERTVDKVFGILLTRWWASLVLGAALVAGGAYWFSGVAEAPGQRAELLRSARETLGAGALVLCGLCMIAVGLSNVFSRSSDSSEEAADELFGILVTRWWVGLLLGAALLCGAVYLLWGVVEAPWANLSPLEIYEAAIQGLCGCAFALISLFLIPFGLFNLFSRSSISSEPQSANPAEPSAWPDRPRD
jgi:hypothetical protein